MLLNPISYNIKVRQEELKYTILGTDKDFVNKLCVESMKQAEDLKDCILLLPNCFPFLMSGKETGVDTFSLTLRSGHIPVHPLFPVAILYLLLGQISPTQ